MRILFALPGLHRYNRGAEIAFIAIASGLAKSGDTVTLIGSGPQPDGAPYRFLHAPNISREYFEAFPSFPPMRSEYIYEELSFLPGLLCRYRPAEFDVTITCSYPFTNWALRRPVIRGHRPPHVFVTQNGDWPAYRHNLEYRLFSCDGLVCTNREYYERHKEQWFCCCIPNGVDVSRFSPGVGRREDFGLPRDRQVVLMVSALIPSKRVSVGVEAVSRIPNAYLVVAGDGPLRQAVDALAANLIPGRYKRLVVTPEKMVDLYRSANVFLHLSKVEPSSLACVEAMACGLPIVAHDLPQLRNVVGDDEFLIDTENPAIIAEQIGHAGLTSSAGFKNRSMKAAAFSWTNIATMYRNFLEEVVELSREQKKAK